MDNQNESELLYEQARLIVERLERISVDSVWARRSSGHRGALLHWIERLEVIRTEGGIELEPDEMARLHALVALGFKHLEKAALERLR
jgi:hypothetical protein